MGPWAAALSAGRGERAHPSGRTGPVVSVAAACVLCAAGSSNPQGGSGTGLSGVVPERWGRVAPTGCGSHCAPRRDRFVRPTTARVRRPGLCFPFSLLSPTFPPLQSPLPGLQLRSSSLTPSCFSFRLSPSFSFFPLPRRPLGVFAFFPSPCT